MFSGSTWLFELVGNCYTIFPISDILKFPVFSVRTALQILQVFQEIFYDLEEANNTSDIFSTTDTQTCDVLNLDFKGMASEIKMVIGQLMVST